MMLQLSKNRLTRKLRDTFQTPMASFSVFQYECPAGKKKDVAASMNKLLDKLDRQLAKHRKEEKTPVMPTAKVSWKAYILALRNLCGHCHGEPVSALFKVPTM